MAEEDRRPLLDRIGARNVNIFLGLVYVLLWAWGIAALLWLPIHANVEWPISHALAYCIGIAVIHFGLIAIGSTLVPNYVYYPVEPKWIYMITDGVIFFALVGVVTSYLLSPISSSLPVYGTYAMILAMMVNIWKLWELTCGSARSQNKSLLGA